MVTITRDSARRWGRRLLWLLPTLLAIYLLVKLADFAWYRTQIPVGFHNANWSGSWETKGYGGLSGRLLVRLPDPLTEDQDFKVEALVYYPIYSVWKTGQFVKMDLSGRYSPGASTSAGQSTNPIPSGGLLKFKGIAGRQVVEYSALVDESRTRIVGGYLSREPDDYGYFFIRYY
jgi:hypothetical protein